MNRLSVPQKAVRFVAGVFVQLPVWCHLVEIARAEDITVAIDFRHPEVSQHWVNLVEFGLHVGFIKIRSVPLGEHKGLCELYLKESGLPGACRDSIYKLARRLNPDFKNVSTTMVKVPDLKLRNNKKELYRIPPPKVLEKIYGKKKYEALKRKFEARASENSSKQNNQYGFAANLQLNNSEQVKAFNEYWSKNTNLFPNSSLSIQPRTPQDPPLFATYIHPSVRWNACKKVAVSKDEKPVSALGAYDELVKGRDWNIWKQKCQCDPNKNKCPVVVMIDQPVFAHQSLGDRLVHGLLEDHDRVKHLNKLRPLDKPEEVRQLHKNYCPNKVFVKKEHHGTHLAGIIAGQPNADTSHFVGTAPNVPIVPIAWDGDQIKLNEAIDMILGYFKASQSMLIWTFTSTMRYNSIDGLNASLETDRSRLTNPPQPLLRFINPKSSSSGPPGLLIVAIGQPNPEEKRTTRFQIVKNRARTPMNLGDRDNIVVVTACRNCDQLSPKLWHEADFAENGLVSVAAPGALKVPSTATTKMYTEANGTSVATAYVAGVAASMAACHPGHYNTAEKLKVGLQLYANPVVHAGDKAHVSTGVVNPRLSVHCDPKFMWLRTNNASLGSEEICGRKISKLKWCKYRPEFGTLKSNGQDLYDDIPAEQIYRIIKLHKSVLNKEAWVLYYNKIDEVSSGSTVEYEGAARLRKGRPFQLAADHKNDNLIWVRYADNQEEETIKLSSIKDLIIGKRVKFHPTSKCNP